MFYFKESKPNVQIFVRCRLRILLWRSLYFLLPSIAKIFSACVPDASHHWRAGTHAKVHFLRYITGPSEAGGWGASAPNNLLKFVDFVSEKG